MAFHETRFPTGISLNSSGGPMRKTQVATGGTGYEARNQQWADSRREYNAGSGVKGKDDLYEVMAFFEERRGRLHGFRWKDPFDWKSSAPSVEISETDQSLGTGDGVETEFQLVKTYGSSFDPYERVISKPVSGTVVVAIDSVTQASGWSVDTTTGIITFDVAPGLGLEVTAGFEFDVPVRFDTDSIMANGYSFNSGELSIPLIEIREIS